MIGARREAPDWAVAAGLSAALHLAALGFALSHPALRVLAPEPAAEAAPLEITAITVDPAAAPAEPLRTVAAPAGEVIAAATTAPLPAPASLAVPAGSTRVPASDPADLPLTPIPEVLRPLDAPAAIAAAPAATAPSPLTLAPQAEAPPPDPRLLELVDRIRGRLTDPCLLALPQIRDGALELAIIADDDRAITPLMDSLTQGLGGTGIGRNAALLDARQCPAVAFARRDPRYPVFGLGLSLDSQTVASGQALRGRITNGEGYDTTLLLIDDNGVVHDLRPFLRQSAGSVAFDAPVARDGAARETQLLLVALAAPRRPAAIAAHAGELAGPFFDALFAEIGQDALIGVASVYLR